MSTQCSALAATFALSLTLAFPSGAENSDAGAAALRFHWKYGRLPRVAGPAVPRATGEVSRLNSSDNSGPLFRRRKKDVPPTISYSDWKKQHEEKQRAKAK
jgi:hypothetical protein